MIKQNYKLDKKSKYPKKAPPKDNIPPWKACKVCLDNPPEIQRLINTNNIRWTSFTSIYGEYVFTDLGAILRQTSEGETCKLQMAVGKEELTNWASLKKTFGTSRIRIFNLNGEEMVNSTIRLWAKPRNIQALRGYILQLEVVVELTTRERHGLQDLLNKGVDFIEQLKSSNEEELACRSGTFDPQYIKKAD